MHLWPGLAIAGSFALAVFQRLTVDAPRGHLTELLFRYLGSIKDTAPVLSGAVFEGAGEWGIVALATATCLGRTVPRRPLAWAVGSLLGAAVGWSVAVGTAWVVFQDIAAIPPFGLLCPMGPILPHLTTTALLAATVAFAQGASLRAPLPWTLAWVFVWLLCLVAGAGVRWFFLPPCGDAYEPIDEIRSNIALAVTCAVLFPALTRIIGRPGSATVPAAQQAG